MQAMEAKRVVRRDEPRPASEPRRGREATIPIRVSRRGGLGVEWR